MLRHADEWIVAWNRRDLDRVLAGFAEHASFRSPLAERITGSALVEGKPQIAAYWHVALADHSELRFELVDVICDVEAEHPWSPSTVADGRSATATWSQKVTSIIFIAALTGSKPGWVPRFSPRLRPPRRRHPARPRDRLRS